MDRTRWERIQEIFHQVSEAPPEQQRGYLQMACGDDETLIAELLDMLEEDVRATSLLEDDLPLTMRGLFEEHSSLPAEADFGPYKIIRLLGQGGMGIVYLARRDDIGSLAAIKLLRDGLLSPERRLRFAREQRTLARLVHPLIAQIYDADTLEDGTPWFAMEYVEGKPIVQYCADQACTLDVRLRLFRSVCEAVQHAHRKLIVHRDLKPSNILVTPDGSVKLLDFGIAREPQDPDQPVQQTLTAQRPMTLPYASPEQVRGDPLGTQTDVYSLGVILYELLAGRLPFDFSNLSRTEAESLVLAREADPPSLIARRTLRGPDEHKTATTDLDVLTLTAMHKDTQRRYRSVEALIRDLDHYLRGEPLEAQPDSRRYRLGKFIRRNRPVVLATATVSAIIVFLVVFFVFRLARARNAALADAVRTQRIEEFMLNLFDGGDKTAGPSGNLQVVTLLDRGVKSARNLNAEPAVQAELYQTLGNMYQKLGKPDQADPLLRSAMDLRKSTAGPQSHEVADSLVTLGLLRQDQGQLGEAERLVREGLAIDSRRLRADDPKIAKDKSALGQVLEERGAYAEAMKNLDEAIHTQSAKGEVTKDLSESMAALATVQYDLGHPSIAEFLFRRTLAMDIALYGAVHPRVADDYYDIGAVQHDLGHDREGEQYYRQALAIKESWYGTEHPETAMMMVALGQSLVYQGRFDEAAPVLEKALALEERLFGKVHRRVAAALNILGLLELRRGRLDEAEKDFTRMADIDRAVYDDRHYLVGDALLNLGEVYLAQKNTARAEWAYREALSRFTERLSPAHANTAATQIRLGHVLVLEHRYKEAEGHLLAGYQVVLKLPGDQATRIHNARTDLITVYQALHQPDQVSKLQAALAAGPPH